MQVIPVCDVKKQKYYTHRKYKQGEGNVKSGSLQLVKLLIRTNKGSEKVDKTPVQLKLIQAGYIRETKMVYIVKYLSISSLALIIIA